jgi:hypothetical protein
VSHPLGALSRWPPCGATPPGARRGSRIPSRGSPPTPALPSPVPRVAYTDAVTSEEHSSATQAMARLVAQRNHARARLDELEAEQRDA